MHSYWRQVGTLELASYRSRDTQITKKFNLFWILAGILRETCAKKAKKNERASEQERGRDRKSQTANRGTLHLDAVTAITKI